MTTSEPNSNQPILQVGGREETTVGNYFVANYPPFSVWNEDRIHDLVRNRLDEVPDPGVPFGLYVHVPFCRRRCDFCYFRVYTGRDAKDVTRYLDAVIAELARYARHPRIQGRKPRFVYFGGGTPSFLSVDQLRYLFTGLQQHLPWDEAQEVTFECEPGTLDDEKIRTLSELGVTRLSLGVENFNPEILELNNRAHRAKEIGLAYESARAASFPQINIDLIAGMVGETEENWQDCISKTRALAPEAVTIYQMEAPYNTTVFRNMKDGGEEVAPVADWKTKRRWVDQAFAALQEDGYRIGSAYTAVKSDDVSFLYRDGLWHGADMLGLGVASFSHLGGLHFQNEHDLEPYADRVEAGALPVHRGLSMSDDEKLIREFILQLKLGTVGTRYFQDKFGVDVRTRFEAGLRQHADHGWLSVDGETITLSRAGLLRVDTLLPSFFLDAHRDKRYA
ncbi:MAG: coproporphyrinogen III oxidase [Planctomycetes bacterium]|nr:coproporphyrinogen III oxidase [Planctomycetota bacterium]